MARRAGVHAERARRDSAGPCRRRGVARALGAFLHAGWLRWDRWRLEMIWQDLKHALRALRSEAGLHVRDGVDAGDRHRRHDRDLRRRERRAPSAAAVSGSRSARAGLQDVPQAARSHRRRRVAARLHRLAPRQHASSPSWRRSTTGSFAAHRRRRAPNRCRPAGDRRVLRVHGHAGRCWAASITTDDDPMGGRDVVVLSHAIWTRRFGSNPGIIGQQIVLDGVVARSDRRHAAGLPVSAAVGDVGAASLLREGPRDPARRALHRRASAG